MGTVNVRHLWAYRFPAATVPDSDVDHYLILEEFTESNMYNVDGTKVRRRGVMAHGPRDRIMETTEKIIDEGMSYYRSRNYSVDHLRVGVENALDDATEVAAGDAVEDIEVSVSVAPHADDGPKETVISVIEGNEWNERTGHTGRKGLAPASGPVMAGVARVDELFEDQPVSVSRTLRIKD